MCTMSLLRMKGFQMLSNLTMLRYIKKYYSFLFRVSYIWNSFCC